MVNNYWKYFIIYYLHTSSNSKLSSEVYVTLITISVLLELIGIALGKEE